MGGFAVYPILSYKKNTSKPPSHRPRPLDRSPAGATFSFRPWRRCGYPLVIYVKQFATENGPVEIVDD